MKRPELLSPVGNMECLKAAIAAGCDAVYLGGYTFGARNYAGNFSNEEIVEVVKLCHLYGVKVYITVNTLIYDSEVEMFLDYIDFLYHNNIDAVIMQDLGMIDLIRKTYPNLDIHASTQMHIHSLEGVRFANSLGLKRVVMARETSIDTIKKIKENLDIELEAFVHGALCVSYSGQCLISSLIGGRSGNRGNCAQICRKKFTLLDDKKQVIKTGYLLSMKDLMTLQNIDKLINSGIDSFKIEGRMKRPEYVYLITKLYRQAIDSYLTSGFSNIKKQDIWAMMKLFNREFTEGYIFESNYKHINNDFRPNHLGIELGKVIQVTNNMVKIKLFHDVRNGDGIRIISKNEDIGLTISFMYKNKKVIKEAHCGDIIELKVKGKCQVGDMVRLTTDYLQLQDINKEMVLIKRKVKVGVEVNLGLNQPVVLKVDDGLNCLEISDNIQISKAMTRPIDEQSIIRQLSKLGNSVYEINHIKVVMDDNIFVNLKDINDLRRKMVTKLNEARLYQRGYMKQEYYCKVPNFPVVQKYNVLISDFETYKNLDIDKYDEIIVDNIELYSQLKNQNVTLKLPRVMTNYDNYPYHLLVGELGSLYKYHDIDIDFSLNVTNSYTVAFLHSLGVNKITLSYELGYNQIKELIDNYQNRYQRHPNLEVISKAYEEVMVTKLNLLSKYNLGATGYLQDAYNNCYLLRSNNDIMTIYNYRQRILENEKNYFSIGINYLRDNLDITFKR